MMSVIIRKASESMERWYAGGTGINRGHLGGLIMALLAGLVLTACQGSLDQSLVTGGTQTEYRASVDPLIPKFSKHELEAFNWAVADFDLAKLHSKYPGASPRKIIRGQVREVLSTYPEKIKALEAAAVAEAPLRAELRKIIPSDAEFGIEENFFGLQPFIGVNIRNGSRYPVSQMRWKAALFLDGTDRPAAQTILVNDYRKNGGLKPGSRFHIRFPIGFVKGDEAWTTLEIRNAATRKVVLEPVLDSILDFGEHPYLAKDPVPRIEQMNAAVELAELYSDI